jgi:hypothetical protein
MKTPRNFEKLSTSAGLLVLGAGFVSIGALSFIKRHLEDAESGLLLNSAYPIIGSLISILLGFAFFAIALLFMATRLKEEKALRKPGRARDLQPNPIGESSIDNSTRSRHDDRFEPEVEDVHDGTSRGPCRIPSGGTCALRASLSKGFFAGNSATSASSHK